MTVTCLSLNPIRRDRVNACVGPVLSRVRIVLCALWYSSSGPGRVFRLFLLYFLRGFPCTLQYFRIFVFPIAVAFSGEDGCVKYRNVRIRSQLTYYSCNAQKI